MSATSGISRCQNLFRLLARACIVAGLMFCPMAARGLPRSPFPPVPETTVIFHEGFDGFHSIGSGDARAVIPGVGTLVESWSGYALQRAGTKVLPWILPAVDPASGHTNLTCDTDGAIRFWFEPHFSSASIAGGTGPGGTAHLADLAATSAAGTVVVWSLQISPDGTVLKLLGYSDSGPVQILSTPIAWQARQSHNLVLNFGPDGAALFVDSQMVAQGAGTVAFPASVGALVLGSSMAGTHTAQGSLDEFFSFKIPVTPDSVAFYYQFTGPTAVLGPISASEAVLAVSGSAQMALPRVYDPNHDITCSPGGPVYITNIFATLQDDGMTTFSFDIQGGTNGVLYDIFATDVVTNSLANHTWNWIGQGMTCNTYSFSNQPPDLSFYILGVPLYTMTVGLGNNGYGQRTVPAGSSNSMAVAAGGYFSLALQNNGTILAWGDNAYGETNIPAGITNAVAIAAGQYHGLALLTNGSVRSWGSYWDGITNYPVTNFQGIAGPPTSNVMAIAAGAGHDLALMSNGTVVSWGLTNLWPNSSKALALQTNLTGVKAVACGWDHNVALLSNGVVKAWGLNASNLWNLTNVPGDLTNVVAIAAFGLHSLALRTNGTVEAWGYSPNGETNVPAGLTNVVAIAAGGGQSLALQANGTTVIWGFSSLTNIPAGLVAAKTIAGGFLHSLVLQSYLFTPIITEQPADQYAPAGSNVMFSALGESLDGVQYQWQFDGTNITGATSATLTLTNVQASNEGSYQVVVSAEQAFIKSYVATFTLIRPPQIVSIWPPANSTNWINQTTVLSVYVHAAGQRLYPLHYLWTLNGTNLSSIPSRGASATYDLSWDGNYGLTITNAAGSTTNMTWNFRSALPGEVIAWGSDDSFECDQSYGLSNATWIAAGEYHSVAVTEQGTVVQWGKYFDGDNYFSLGSTPSFTNLIAVAAGMEHDIGLKADGKVATWGLTNAVANYFPTNLLRAKAVACGWYHNVVLQTNGSVAAWGANTNGVTNVPPNLTNCTAIAAGGLHSLALTASNTVFAWGDNSFGECNVPAGLTNGQTNVVAIAAGDYHSLALTSKGTVVAWGDTNSGQCNVPAGPSNVMAIAAGAAHSLALKNDGTFAAWGDNGSGQANVPNTLQRTVVLSPSGAGFVTNSKATINVKMIAAGGDHNMAAIFNPAVQYPVDVSKDLLLIYNTNSPGNGSSNVCAYYLANRPMVSNANTLGIGCITNEIIEPGDYSTNIAGPIQRWLASNPTKRPAYVILFQDIPSRVDSPLTSTPSVQYELNTACATNWSPLVTSINMNGTGGTNDCIAYINKLTSMTGTNQTLFISASTRGYGNTNWYFDYTNPEGLGFSYSAIEGVLGVNSNASVIYTNVTSYPAIGTLAGHLTNGINVAGFLSWGLHGYWGDTNGGYATNGTIQFMGNSGWYLIETGESFNGQRDPCCNQGNFLSWFAVNAFGGMNYSNTPVGAVSQVDAAPGPRG